jgi:hypothetical protein
MNESLAESVKLTNSFKVMAGLTGFVKNFAEVNAAASNRHRE